MELLQRIAGGGLVPLVNHNITEFRRFKEILGTLGIPHMVHHGSLPKAEWQETISSGGYNLTSLACFYIQVGDMQYVFSTGKAHWTGDPLDSDSFQGHGPPGVFLLARNSKTGEVMLRTSDGHTGIHALAYQYGFTV